jgi:chromosome segregation ATPase
MNEGPKSIESAAVELQNLRKGFEDHVRQLVQKDAEIERLKTEHQVMKKFLMAAFSAKDRMSSTNNQLRYLITELTNAAQTPEGVPSG